MAAYTSKASGDFNADGQTTWNEVGHPDGADDTAAIATGHAITAAAAVVCGAITIAGTGSLVAQAAANTITSITNNGTGVCTIGATTFAGVLVNASTGLLTINGALTGITNFTPSNCNMNANVTMSGTLTGPATGTTFAMAAGTTLSETGVSGNAVSFAGTWTMGAGCTLSGTKAAEWVAASAGVGGTFTATGTAGSPISITNATALRNARLGASLVASGTYNLTHVNLDGVLAFVGSAGLFNLSYVQFAPKVAADVIQFNSTTPNPTGLFRYCWVAGVVGTTFLSASPFMQPGIVLENIAIGYARTGAANALTTGQSSCCAAHVRNCIINATTQVSGVGRFSVDNLGYLDAAMVAGGSALAAAVVDPGVSKTWGGYGTVERSTANPRTATYHERSTPESNVTTTHPLDFSIYVPISSGEDIAVSVYASRSAMTSDCAKIVIDPEQAWFTTATSAELLTNAATYYQLTASASTARGAGATGMVRVVMRVDEYAAAQYVDWDDFAVTIT